MKAESEVPEAAVEVSEGWWPWEPLLIFEPLEDEAGEVVDELFAEVEDEVDPGELRRKRQ